jgi:site-specific DNA-adenine methylase
LAYERDKNIDNLKLVPPCAYQGGKQRIAKQIVNIIKQDETINKNTKFYDLCCGSGAISIEMVNQGFSPSNIYMVDKSPWGLFWKSIGDSSFSSEVFKAYIDNIPKDVSKIQSYIKGLSQTPVYKTQTDIPYIFILLQASSFGSKSIWIKDEKWQNCSFRNYWLPTKTSSRRSPVNPMMPMPNTLLERIEQLSMGMKGVNGCYGDCNDVVIEPNSIIYIDPPYSKTTKYGYEFNYMSFIKNHQNQVLQL